MLESYTSASVPAAAPVVWRRRAAAMTGWLVLFTGGCALVGLPTDPAYAFVWLWAATVAWNSHLPWWAHLRFARDWLPAIVLLVVYNLSRGYADHGAVPHVHEMITTDVRMWGWATGGRPPTVWMQEHLYDPTRVRWWDLGASFVYFTHFVATPAIAVVLWLRDRGRWAAFMRRWIALSAAGLATYFAYPAAPPWWAAQYALIGPVARISTRGWQAIGLHGAGNLLNAAQLDASNPVAAMPSLHTAFALLAVAFFAPGLRRRWWPLLAGYPLAMTFTLVYAGEHWVIDVLVGWAYVAVVLGVVAAAERWWAHRRGGGTGGFGPPPYRRDPGRGQRSWRLAAPVAGSRMSRWSHRWVKSTMPVSGPATASNEPSPMRPLRQLSSTKRRIEIRSVSVLSTKLLRVQGR